MPRRPQRKFDPEIRFRGLAGSLIHRGLFTKEEITGFLRTAQLGQGPPDIWNCALDNLITEANLRLANRGKNQYNANTKREGG